MRQLCPVESRVLGILGLVGGRTRLLIISGDPAVLLSSPCLSSLAHHAAGDSQQPAPALLLAFPSPCPSATVQQGL